MAFIRGGHDYGSQYNYRKHLAAKEGYASRQARQKDVRAIRQIERASRRSRDARDRALDAIGESRRTGVSISEAARRSGTTVENVRKYAGSALDRLGHQLRAKSSDDLPRIMNIMTPGGIEERVLIHGSRDARLISEQANAIRYYIQTGDYSRMQALSGYTVSVKGRRVPVQIDRRTLDTLTRAGVADEFAPYPESR